MSIPTTVDAVKQMLIAMQEDDNLFQNLEVSIMDMEFQGFQPEVLLAHMGSLAKKANITAAENQRNIVQLAVLGTMRGSSLTKILAKSTDKLKDFLNGKGKKGVIGIYGIQSGQPTSNTTVTLLRVAACLAGNIVKGLADNSLPISTTVNPDTVAKGYPKCLCISTLGSLIPPAQLGGVSSEDSDALMKAFMWHQVLFDQIINPNVSKRSSKAKIQQFAQIQCQSRLYDIEQRVNILLSAGILVKRGNTAEIASEHRPSIMSAARSWSEYA